MMGIGSETMCESSAYVVSGQSRELLMKDVVKATVEGDTVTCTNILGETKSVTGNLSEINLVAHTLTISKS